MDQVKLMYISMDGAVNEGDLEEVRSLVQQGADVNGTKYGRSHLMTASETGQPEMVSLLLELGADASVTNNIGYTALNFAQESGHEDVVRVLTGGGSLPKKTLDDYQPLWDGKEDGWTLWQMGDKYLPVRQPGNWALFIDDVDLARQVCDKMRAAGISVVQRE